MQIIVKVLAYLATLFPSGIHLTHAWSDIFQTKHQQWTTVFPFLYVFECVCFFLGRRVGLRFICAQKYKLTHRNRCRLTHWLWMIEIAEAAVDSDWTHAFPYLYLLAARRRTSKNKFKNSIHSHLFSIQIRQERWSSSLLLFFSNFRTRIFTKASQLINTDTESTVKT